MSRINVAAASLVFSLVILFNSPASTAAEDCFVPMLPAQGLEGWINETGKAQDSKTEENPNWVNQDGVLHCDGREGGFLRYETSVCDFIWRLEYRVTPGCNSGIGIRGIPYNGKFNTRPSVQSYEIQILDDAGKEPNKHSTGSLYRYVAAKESTTKKPGEWNQMEIECVGPRIKITLNGTLIQDVDQSQIAELKNKPVCGFLQLQDHRRKVDFRNLELKVIKAK